MTHDIETVAAGKPHESAVEPVECATPGCGKSEHAKGLIAIGIFKLCKATFFFGLGLTALHLVHRNIGEIFLRISTQLHFNPAGEFVGKVEDAIDLISGHQLRQLSLATFGYAGISLTEGIGLMLEKTWAEYLTLTLTICALPWEVYEVARHPTMFRVGVLLTNLVVLAYLLWFLRRKKRRKAARLAAGC
jgi:uncharacterized membrane protein (DUF2068 family)